MHFAFCSGRWRKQNGRISETMSNQDSNQDRAEEVWRTYMTEGRLPDFAKPKWFEKKYLRPLIRLIPSDPRCRLCYYPFEGIGGTVSRHILGLAPSKLNPQLCNVCENLASVFPGGAEIEVSVLFADVRGSTTIAEKMSPTEFSRLMDRFYKATTKVLFRRNAMLEKFIGDEVTGFFAPGFAGEMHAQAAIDAGLDILRAAGYGDLEGPWIPVGVGVHTGMTFVGGVSAEGGKVDITILGDTPNTGSRITAQAAPGELLISETAIRAAGMDTEGLSSRLLTLKGREEPVEVWARRVDPS
jgi:adenylate cyclase